MKQPEDDPARLDDMVKGYLSGFRGDHAAAKDLKRPAWRHGYRNGDADRVGVPAGSADVLRRRANMILGRP